MRGPTSAIKHCGKFRIQFCSTVGESNCISLMLDIAVILYDLCVHVYVRHAKVKTKEYQSVYKKYLNVLGLACLQYVAVCMLISFLLTQLPEKSPRPVPVFRVIFSGML